MNDPHPPENPFLLDSVDEPLPVRGTPIKEKSKKRKARMAALIGAPLLIFALGVFAWTTRGDRNDARSALADARSENQTLTDALELHRASSDDLGGKLEVCKTTVQESGTRVNTLEANLAAAKTQVGDLRKQRGEAKARLKEFDAVTRSFQSMINTGKLKVIFRQGQMIVKLPAKVLFPSGRAEVSKAGATALAEVAAILKKMGKRKFTVAGHTDNVGISTDEFKSNWELSAARAVAVVEILTAKGVPPKRLVAAGFGPYAPVASNRSQRGRQQNRRMEIILEPYLRPPPKVAKKAVRKKK